MIARPLRGADVGAEMDPAFRSADEARPALHEGIEAEMTEFMAA